jgi:hypothetical protein
MGPMPGTVVNRATTGSCAAIVATRSSAVASSSFRTAMTRCNGASVSAIDDGRLSAATRTRKLAVLPLRIRSPAPRVIARVSAIARVRLSVKCATDIELRLHRALRCRSPMGRAITSPVTRVRQRGDIAPIGFDASAALAIHGRECRIGHNHLVAEGLKMLRDPLALGRGLQQNVHRPPSLEHGREAVACRRDPPVDHLATLRDNPNLAFFFMQVDGTIFHGWSSPVRHERVSVMWSKLPRH